jgi:hypothetical protein
MAVKTLKIIGTNVIVFLVLLSLIEVALQVYALIRPAYDVLFLQPDRSLGWKQVPNLRWTWAGLRWCASDFTVDIETNPLGFRDMERKCPRHSGVKRVALLGDSFIEAVQVPFEKTAGQLLQQGLNNCSDQSPKHSWQWEVLNFGISNYGVGQYLLTWEQYAKEYKPDYVAVFVAELHMIRTVSKYEYAAFPKSTKNGLRVRPTFRLENDKLIREPAEDFNEFLNVQEGLIETEFSGKRSRRKKQLITVYYADRLKEKLAILSKRFQQNSKQIKAPYHSYVYSGSAAELLAINLKIIQEIGRQVVRAGGKLIVLDASRYFGDDETISVALRELCSKNDLGYIPLYDHLMKANSDGIPTRWARDGHFNEAGNDVLAKALLRYIKENSL